MSLSRPPAGTTSGRWPLDGGSFAIPSRAEIFFQRVENPMWRAKWAGYAFAMSVLRPRFRISHTAFCIGFAAVLFVTCNTLNFERIARWFRVGDALDLSALAAYLLAALCLFIAFFTLLAHRWTIKPLAILLTVSSAAVTYFIAKYGVAIDSSMIRNAV